MTFDSAIVLDNAWLFLRGYGVTLLLLLAAVPIGLAGGTLLALCQLSGMRLLIVPARAIIEMVRNIPFLIQVFLIFFGLPFYGVDLGPVPSGLLCLSLYCSVYLAEAIRGAIRAVPRGQTEAAYALGLSWSQNMRLIIWPQLPAYLMPAATNVLITLGKETALLSVITVPELTYVAQSVVGRTYAPIEVYSVIVLGYWLTSELISRSMRVLEHRLTPYLRNGAGSASALVTAPMAGHATNTETKT